MQNKNEIVSRYYNENTDAEWKRLEEYPFEFIFTTRMMERHIHSGESVLDIGGGPGRYSLHFAARGCDVTLLDLSEREVAFAVDKADSEGHRIRGICGDCTDDYLPGEKFDHVFLMGPLYHL